jgi:PAS domain S-box-containing protein
MTLAERLKQQIPEILRQWEARVRAVVPAARHESRPVLLNSIPEFLQELVKSLAGPETPDPAPRRAPREHARQRAEHPEYSLEEVIREYSLLRGTIIEMLWPIEHADLKIILEILDGAVAESTTQYVALQATSLRQSEERFRLLIGTVKDYAIYMLDPSGRVVIWNQGAERITGYTAQEIVGQRIDQFYLPADRVEDTPMRHLQRAMQEDRVEIEGWRVRKDGTHFFAHVVIAAIRDLDGTLTGYSKVIRDVTEHRALQVELQRRADALAESNRRKDEFLAVLSHELRNPLAPIVTSVALLRRNRERSPDEQQALDIIERQGKHLVRLVDDLLDVARITHGKITLHKEPLELTTLLTQVAETIRPFLTDRDQTLSLSTPADAVWLEADPTRMSQVFANLLHNSVKFTERGGRLELRAWTEGSSACVELTDTGIGLDSTMLSSVFDIFVQGEQPVDRIVSGLGVGLALVRTLVEMHQGSVKAFSDGPGKGSRFLISLPIHHIERRTPAPEQPDLPFSPVRILVVDDNQDAAMTIAKLLEVAGNKVTTAHDGEQAFQQATAEPPDVILLDIGLPGADGYEVARRLRAAPQFNRTRLIALSGFGREEDQRRSMEAGFDAHLTKPATLEMVQEAIFGPR